MAAPSQLRILALTWMAYVLFNVTRKTTSVVKSRLKTELGLSAYELGAIDTAFLSMYTVGQFLTGTAISRLGAVNVLSYGLLGSAFAIYASSQCMGSTGLILLSGLHGAFQAGAFAACVSIISPWLSESERGTKMGIWSTCSPAGGVLGTAVAAALLGYSGWRAAFKYPAPAVALMGLVCFCFLTDAPPADDKKNSSAHNDPEAHGGSGNNDNNDNNDKPGVVVAAPTFWEAASLPGVANLAMGYFCLKFMRYLLLFWLPFYHNVQLGYDESTAAYMATTFEVGGVFGAIAVGWVSDTFLQGRRTYASMWMLVVAAFFLAAYMAAGASSPLVSGLAMAVVGVLLLGPDSVLSGTICQDIGQRSPYGAGAVGTVTGIVNGCGSVGSILQGFVAAWVSARYGWDAVFFLLIAMSLVAALVLVPAVRSEARSIR